MPKAKKHLIQAWLPATLYQRFRSSPIRRDANSDGEALRALLHNHLKMDTESQEKNADPTTHSVTA